MNFLFKGFEHVFKALKHMYKGLGQVFQVLEHKFPCSLTILVDYLETYL
jgi:hypothetical protein